MKIDMVFEGGGAKGMVFIGAMKELETHGHTPGRLVGTSAGAITAALLAAGYSADEMQEALDERKDGKPVFASFMDPPAEGSFSPEVIEESLTMSLFDKVDIPGVPAPIEGWIDKRIIAALMKIKIYRVIFSFVEMGGLYAGTAFLEWFRGKLDAKGAGYADMTLAEFSAARDCDLSLVASDTGGRTMLVLNSRTAPNCPVAWAVRMSMSIPFAWQEVRWKEAWDPYNFVDVSEGQPRVERRSLAGHTIVDGGALSNFPINLLTSDEPEVRAVMGNTDPNAAPTIGLLIDEDLPVQGAPPPPAEDGDETGIVDDLKRLRTVSRVMRLVNTITAAHDSQLIGIHDELICRMPAKSYGTMEFDMSEPRRDALIAAGQRAMRDYLDGRTDLVAAVPGHA